MSQELFLENGHLSDAGLAALRDGQLDELARLEAAEHLSFCDACLDRYLALAEPVQIQPPEDLTLPVMRRIRQRIARVVMNRYAVAAAAVGSLAGVRALLSGILSQSAGGSILDRMLVSGVMIFALLVVEWLYIAAVKRSSRRYLLTLMTPEREE